MNEPMNEWTDDSTGTSIDTLPTLDSELTQLKNRHASVLGQLQTSTALLEDEVRQLVATAREIETRRIEAQAELNLILEDMERVAKESSLERRHVVLSRMRRNSNAISKAIATRDNAALLAAEKQALLVSDAPLARSYEEYISGKELLARFDPVPGYLLAAHRDLEARVAQIIALDEMMTSAHSPTALTLVFDSLLRCAARSLDVVLPLDVREAEKDARVAALQEKLAEGVWSALVETLRYSSESPVDFQQGMWQDYLCLTIVFDTEIESATLARQFTGYLVQTFESLDNLPFRISLSSTLVDDEIWMPDEEASDLIGERNDIFQPFEDDESPPIPLPAVVIYPQSDAPGLDEEETIPIDAVNEVINSFATTPDDVVIPIGGLHDVDGLNGFFSRRDLVSWNRPLRSAPHSKWNQRARRVRTLLMRMAGTGHIGADAPVRMRDLLIDLPEKDRNDLEHAIEMMTAVGYLNEVRDSEAAVLSIAPDRLEEIASLINRDVTAGWVGILRQT